MKREIRFRIWNPKSKQLGKVDLRGYMGFHGIVYGSVGCNNLDNVWMQYTGLKDKNGKEIYEGDICDGHSDGLGLITWSEYDGSYDYVFSDENVVGLWEVRSDLIVLGNIYENPELLTP